MTESWPTCLPKRSRLAASVHAVAEIDEVEVELQDLILGELTLDQPGQSQLDELAAHRAAVALVHEERVARHLHGDRAESLAHAAMPQVADGRAEDPTPIEPVVLVEAPVFRGEERRAYMRRDVGERHVDAPHHGHASEIAVVLVHDPATFARTERADLAAARAALETAGPQPCVEQDNADACHAERRERTPPCAHPHASGIARCVQPLPEDVESL